MADKPSGNGKNPVPANFAPYLFKPGQSGCPEGGGVVHKRRKAAKPTFLDHLETFFDEEVNDPRDGRGSEKIPRLQYLAMMIGAAACSTKGDKAVRRECIRIVTDALMPVAKGPKIAFLPVLLEQGTAGARFLDAVQQAAAGEAITPEFVMQCLEADAQKLLPVIDTE